MTSALAGEGKTTTALDLARSLAGTGEQVLLVEADLRRPGLGASLALPDGPGLSDVLGGWAELAARCVPAAWTACRCCRPEPSRRTRPSCWGRPPMADLVGTLRGRFDTVLLDVPPVLPVTDAVFADHPQPTGCSSSCAGGAPDRAEVTEAVAMLGRGGVPVLGGVLTRRRLTRPPPQALLLRRTRSRLVRRHHPRVPSR